jgi:nucleotide-binding universal stress UspA family protein
MEKIFNDILLPVDIRSCNDDDMIKAIEFANRLQCNLHLLYIINTAFFPASKMRKAEVKKRMNDLQETHAQGLKEGSILFAGMREGDPESVITHYAITNAIDLVLYHETHNSFVIKKTVNVRKLAGKINCPILSIKSHRVLLDHQIIVLPIGKALPLSKMRVVIYLARHFCASIHLVSVGESANNNDDLIYLQKAYRLLKDHTELDVICNVVEGVTIGDIAVNYASSVNAGLVVVNSGAESVMSGFINKLFSRFVYNQSKVPVMTVV